MAYNPNYFMPAAYYPAFYANQPQNTQHSGLIWVKGEEGANSHVSAPNTTDLLMDSEKPRFFLKTTDASGMPLPLRYFEYTEVFPGKAAPIDYGQFVTKEELNEKLAELLPKKEDVKDANPAL